MNPNHPRFLAELLEKGAAEVIFDGKLVHVTAEVVPAAPEPVGGISQPPPETEAVVEDNDD